MYNQQGDCTLYLSLPKHVMYIYHAESAVDVDIPRKLWQLLVGDCFVLSQIVFFALVIDEALHIDERSAVVPGLVGKFVRKGGEGELLLENGELGVGDGDCEGRSLYGRHREVCWEVIRVI